MAEPFRLLSFQIVENNKMTKIFTPKNVIKYAETRLFGSNIKPEHVKTIKLYNGMLPSELEISMLEWNFETVQQENGREPIYFNNGILFIPQYSGFGRRTRYEEMIKSYIYASQRDIKFESKELNDDERKTNIEYDNLAYDFVTGLFVPDEKYENRRVFEGREINDITKVIFGPTKAVARQAEVTAKGISEYLDSQIIKISNEPVLNISYVYSDQAGIIIDKIMREYDALARKKRKELEIDLYMFGRVGGLKPGLKRHDLVYPTYILDEDVVNLSADGKQPIHNIIGREPSGISLNVASVINEKISTLTMARVAECVCVEMELMETAGAINRARIRYRKSPGKNYGLNINFHFVGHVSDIPLEGDTLADELDSDEGEQAAVTKIVESIGK